MAAAEQPVWPKPCLLQANEMPKASVLTLRGHKTQFCYARSWAGDRVLVSQKTRVKSHWGNCDLLKKKERKEREGVFWLMVSGDTAQRDRKGVRCLSQSTCSKETQRYGLGLTGFPFLPFCIQSGVPAHEWPFHTQRGPLLISGNTFENTQTLVS